MTLVPGKVTEEVVLLRDQEGRPSPTGEKT